MCDDIVWIEVVENRVQQRVVCALGNELSGTIKPEFFFTCLTTSRVSRRTLANGVSSNRK
jgi:hypothetical protein